MKVFFDIVANHSADIITYVQNEFTYRNKTDYPYRDANGQIFDDRDYALSNTFPPMDVDVSFPYTPTVSPANADAKNPAWLNDLTYYHNRGNSTFAGESSQYGDFFGLDDLFTEQVDVVNGFIDIFNFWIDNFDIDGYRLDTAKHVNVEFWQRVAPGRPGARADQRQAGLHHVRRGVRRQPGGAELLHHRRHAALGAGLRAARRDLVGRHQQRPDQHPGEPVRQRRLLHRRRQQRLPVGDLHQQPRPVPCGVLPQQRAAQRVRRRAADPHQLGLRHALLRARLPGGLLRRRAGLHRRRQRQAVPRGHAAQPGAGLHGRGSDRHRRHAGR